MNGPSRTWVARPCTASSGRRITIAPPSIAMVIATEIVCTRAPHGTSSAEASIFTATYSAVPEVEVVGSSSRPISDAV